MVASYNDYRRGDGNCYTAYSLDKGRTWNDSTDPMSFTINPQSGGRREYWQAGGDTSVAWDTKGNAYLDCQVFMRGPGTTNNPDQSSAVYVFRSTKNSGASWNFRIFQPPWWREPKMNIDCHAASGASSPS